MREFLKTTHAILIPETGFKHNFTDDMRGKIALARHAEFLSKRTAYISYRLHYTLKKSRNTCSYTARLKSGRALISTSSGMTHL